MSNGLVVKQGAQANFMLGDRFQAITRKIQGAAEVAVGNGRVPYGCGRQVRVYNLGTPVVPFCPFYLGVSLLKLNTRKKGTLIFKWLLGKLVLAPQKQSFDSQLIKAGAPMRSIVV